MKTRKAESPGRGQSFWLDVDAKGRHFHDSLSLSDKMILGSQGTLSSGRLVIPSMPQCLSTSSALSMNFLYPLFPAWQMPHCPLLQCLAKDWEAMVCVKFVCNECSWITIRLYSMSRDAHPRLTHLSTNRNSRLPFPQNRRDTGKEHLQQPDWPPVFQNWSGQALQHCISCLTECSLSVSPLKDHVLYFSFSRLSASLVAPLCLLKRCPRGTEQRKCLGSGEGGQVSLCLCFLFCKRKTIDSTLVLGAGERHSTHDKGHEEGGSAYTKVGSSRRSPPGYSRASTPKKPESAYFIALCSHLWLYWGLSPTTISLSLTKS